LSLTYDDERLPRSVRREGNSKGGDVVQYIRVYADGDGESHFEDVDVALNLVEFAPPAPPLSVSDWKPAERVGFVSGSPGWRGDPHPTPRRQFGVSLSGSFCVQVNDGESRTIRGGDVVLWEDTTGKGHTSWHEGDEPPPTVFVVQMPD
jgi:hypothetical protein